MNTTNKENTYYVAAANELTNELFELLKNGENTYTLQLQYGHVVTVKVSVDSQIRKNLKDSESMTEEEFIKKYDIVHSFEGQKVQFWREFNMTIITEFTNLEPTTFTYQIMTHHRNTVDIMLTAKMIASWKRANSYIEVSSNEFPIDSDTLRQQFMKVNLVALAAAAQEARKENDKLMDDLAKMFT